MTVAELSFAQTVFAGVVSAAATAVFVGLAAGLVVKIYETRAAARQLVADHFGLVPK